MQTNLGPKYLRIAAEAFSSVWFSSARFTEAQFYLSQFQVQLHFISGQARSRQVWFGLV